MQSVLRLEFSFRNRYRVAINALFFGAALVLLVRFLKRCLPVWVAGCSLSCFFFFFFPFFVMMCQVATASGGALAPWPRLVSEIALAHLHLWAGNGQTWNGVLSESVMELVIACLR